MSSQPLIILLPTVHTACQGLNKIIKKLTYPIFQLFLSEQVNCVKTVSHLVLKPKLTSYIVLNNIVEEFASEVPQDSLIRDDLLHHDDTDSETDGGEMSQDD